MRFHRTWLPGVFSPIRKFWRTCSAKSLPVDNRTSLKLESLETRTVMDVSATFLTGMLTITGDGDMTVSVETVSNGAGALDHFVKINSNDPTRAGNVKTKTQEVNELSIVNNGISKLVDLRNVKRDTFSYLKSVTIMTGGGDDNIFGSDFSDSISGGQGNDVVDGGEGNDTIIGGTGGDKLDGGEGTSSTETGDDLIIGGDGDDEISGSLGHDVYLGGDGNDKITADGAEGEILIGGDGSDILTGGTGSDLLVDGTTSYDSDWEALKAIRNQWASTSSYTSRVNALLGNDIDAPNVPYYFNLMTTIDDGDVDILDGAGGTDWYLRAIQNNSLLSLGDGEWIGDTANTPSANNDYLRVNNSAGYSQVTIPLSTLFLNDTSPNGVKLLNSISSDPATWTFTYDSNNIYFNWGSTPSNVLDATLKYTIKNGPAGTVSPLTATITVHRDAQATKAFVADLDGDGANEVLDFRPGEGKLLTIEHDYVSNSNAVVEWGAVSAVSLWKDPLTGDFNGDGRTDFAARDGMTGEWKVWISRPLEASSSPYQGQSWGVWSTGLNWSDALVGDFNGDGRDDIFGYEKNAAEFFVSLSTGAGFTMESWGSIKDHLASFQGLIPSFRTIDVDGDKQKDVLVYDATSSSYAFVLSRGLKFSSLSIPASLTNWTANFYIGNFDGLPGDDVLGQKLSSGQSTPTFQLLTYHPGESSLSLDSPSSNWGSNSYSSSINFKVTDINHDGYSDLLGYNPTTARWLVGLNLAPNNATAPSISFQDWNNYFAQGNNYFNKTSWSYSGVNVVDSDMLYRQFLETFSWISNNVELEFYPGFLKGAKATRETKAGNDWDQANLLISDLRSKGIEADFVYGTVTADVVKVAYWLGLADVTSSSAVQTMLQILGKSPGAITNGKISFDHTWVRVKLAGLTPSGNGVQAFDVDPSWKFKDYQPGLPSIFSQVLYSSMSPTAVTDTRRTYLNAVNPTSDVLPLPLDYYESRVQEYLKNNLTNGERKSLADVTFDGPIHQVLFTSIPKLGFDYGSTINTIDKIPSQFINKLTLQLTEPTNTIYWSATLDVPDVSLSSLSIDWISPVEFAVWRRSGTGTNTWYIDQDGSRNWDTESSNAHAISHFGGGYSDEQPLVGDFDGDGEDQLAIYRPSTGTFILDADSDRATSSGDYTILDFGAAGGTGVSGDWDGDGKDDLAVFSQSEGWKFDIDGDGGFDIFREQRSIYGRDVSGVRPLVGDWNSDGKDDLGYWSVESGVNHFHLDVDGDQTTQGDWDIFKYGNTSLTYSTNDLPVAGDWDGDGRTDIGLFNSSTATWRLYRITSSGILDVNPGQMQVSTFGDPNLSTNPFRDVPVVINADKRGTLRRHPVLRNDGIAIDSTVPIMANAHQNNQLESNGNSVVLEVTRTLASQPTSYLQSETQTYKRKAGQTLVLALQALQQSSEMVARERSELNQLINEAIQATTFPNANSFPQTAPRIVTQLAQLAGTEYFNNRLKSSKSISGLANSLRAIQFFGSGLITVSEGYALSHSNSIPYVPDEFFVDIKNGTDVFINRTTGNADMNAFRLSADQGSGLEHQAIESLVNTEAVSTMKALALAANDTTDAVYSFTGPYVAQDAAWTAVMGSEHDPTVKSQILDVLAHSGTVVFTKKKTVVGTGTRQWNGSVYLAETVDQATGRAVIRHMINKDNSGYDGGYIAGPPQNDLFTLPRSTVSSYVGDPVKVDTGSYYRQDTDFAIPNLGRPLELTRYYGSQEADVSHYVPNVSVDQAFRDVGFGYGWRFTYSHFLRLTKGTSWNSGSGYASTGNIEWYTPDGKMFTFTKQGANYSTPNTLNGTFSTYSSNGISGFIYTEKDGTTYIFESVYHDGSFYDSAGTARLVQITDRYGNGVKISYVAGKIDSNNKFTGQISELGSQGETNPGFMWIDKVSDAVSPARYIHFTYNSGLVSNINDWTGRVWSYGYSQFLDLRTYTTRHFLGIATQFDGLNAIKTESYSYYDYYDNVAAVGLMKEYHDAAGGVIRIDYYANRKVMRTTDQNGGTNYFSYDVYHRETIFTNERMEVEKYKYDTKGRQIEKIATDGTREGYVWNNSTDRMTSSVDAFGFTENYQYNGLILVGTIFANALKSTSGSLDTYGNAEYLALRNLNDNVLQSTWIDYDSMGRKRWEYNANNYTVLYSYDATTFASSGIGARGLMTSSISARGTSKLADYSYLDSAHANREAYVYANTAMGDDFITYYIYNDAGQILGTIHDSIRAFADQYSASGFLDRHESATGEFVVYERDKIGRVLQETRSAAPGSGLSSITTHFEYDGEGRILKSTDSLDRVTRYVYDRKGQLLETILPDLTRIVNEYDKFGNLLKQTDVLGRVTRFQYDSRNRLISTLYADGTVERIRYDAASKVLAKWDGNGNETNYAYDKMGRIVREQSADPDAAIDDRITSTSGKAAIKQYVYDDVNRRGKLVELKEGVIDDNGIVTIRKMTRYVYDGVDNVTRVDTVDGTSGYVKTIEIYSYDANNNRTQSDVYDVSSKNWQITPSDAQTLNNELSSLLSGPNGNNNRRTTKTTYDSFDRVYDEYQSYDFGATNYFVRTEYDGAGRVKTVTDQRNNTTTNNYDGFGRLKSVVSPKAHPNNLNELNPTVTNNYDQYGRLESRVDANGNVTKYDFDILDRVVRVSAGFNSPDVAKRAITNYVFDVGGQLISTIDPRGRADHSVYDLRGRTIRHDEADPDGIGGVKSNVTTFSYDGAGNTLSKTDAIGNTTRFIYDAWNRVQMILDPDPDGVTGLLPRLTFYSYDAFGNTKDIWEGSYSVDTDGKITVFNNSSTTPVRTIGTYTYDYERRVLTEKLGDPDYNIYAVIGAAPNSGAQLGAVTTNDYNGFGNLKRTQLALGASTFVYHFYDYDKFGRVISDATASDGNATDSTYSSKVETAYHPDGNIKSVTTRYNYASGAGASTTVTYDYDALGRLETVTQPDPDGGGGLLPGKTVYGYDLNGNKTSKTVTLGVGNGGSTVTAVTGYAYDTLNRLVKTTEPVGSTAGTPETSDVYNAAGELVSIKDANGNITKYFYDDTGRVVEEVNPEGLSRKYSYDELGRRVKKVDRDGRTTIFTYDSLSRLIFEKWFDAGVDLVNGSPSKSISYDYDPLGRLYKVSEGDNGASPVETLRYSYDNMDRIIAIVGKLPDNQQYGLTYTYDLDQLKQVNALVANNGAAFTQLQTTYTFDGIRRVTGAQVTGIADGTTTTTVFSNLFHDGNLKDTQLQYNGATVGTLGYGYDLARRMIKLEEKTSSNTNIATYDFTYNSDDWITSLISTRSQYNDGTASYTYDNRGELTDAVYSDPAYGDDLGFNYDLVGNRASTLNYNSSRSNTTGSATYGTGTENQLASDGIYSYRYDNEGHLTDKQRMVDNGAGGQVLVSVAHFSWDNRGRLVQVDLKAENAANNVIKVVKYSYDILDHRVRRQVDNDPSTSTTYDIDERYVYDGNQLAFVVNSASQVQAKYGYVPGLPEVVMARLRNSGGSESAYWLLGDQQGSVKDVIGINIGSTTPAQHIRYDAYGNIKSIDGTLNGAAVHLGYTGQERDSATGLLYYGARWYDPATGRFISQDPSGFDGGDDMNLYRYVGNNAATLIDAMGLSASRPSSGGYSPLSTSNYTPAFTPMSLTGTPWNASNSQFDAHISQQMTLNSLQNTTMILPTSLTNTSTSTASSSSSQSWWDWGTSLASSAKDGTAQSISTIYNTTSNFVKDVSYINWSGAPAVLGETISNGKAADSAAGAAGRLVDNIAYAISAGYYQTGYAQGGGIYGNYDAVQGSIGLSDFTQGTMATVAGGKFIQSAVSAAPKILQTGASWLGAALSTAEKTSAGIQFANGDPSRALSLVPSLRSQSNATAGTPPIVNPGFPAPDRKWNCVNCAIATDLTFSGRPASAMPFSSTKGMPISKLEDMFGGKFIKGLEGQDDIDYVMSKLGPGSRGIVFGDRGPVQVGHVFNTVVSQNGAVKYFDGQTGKAASFSSSYTGFRLLITSAE